MVELLKIEKVDFKSIIHSQRMIYLKDASLN